MYLTVTDVISDMHDFNLTMTSENNTIYDIFSIMQSLLSDRIEETVMFYKC